MSWTKRELVNQAFESVGLAAFVFDLSADQIVSAVRQMDSMLATWNGKGIQLGYPIASGGNGSDPDQDSNLPDYAVEAVYSNLGIRLAPSYGKVVSPDLKTSAKQAYDLLLAQAAMPLPMQITGLPSGAGNKTPIQPFLLPADTGPIFYGDNDQLIFGE